MDGVHFVRYLGHKIHCNALFHHKNWCRRTRTLDVFLRLNSSVLIKIYHLRSFWREEAECTGEHHNYDMPCSEAAVTKLTVVSRKFIYNQRNHVRWGFSPRNTVLTVNVSALWTQYLPWMFQHSEQTTYHKCFSSLNTVLTANVSALWTQYLPQIFQPSEHST